MYMWVCMCVRERMRACVLIVLWLLVCVRAIAFMHACAHYNYGLLCFTFAGTHLYAPISGIVAG